LVISVAAFPRLTHEPLVYMLVKHNIFLTFGRLCHAG
jgi:hypothetical protein